MRVPTFEIVLGAGFALVLGLGALVLRANHPEPTFVVLAAEPVTMVVPTTSTTATPTTATPTTTTTAVPASPPSTLGPLTTGFRGETTVAVIVDGDTLVVDHQGRIPFGFIRLAGINTPEPKECGADRATARLSELLPPGTVVMVEVGEKASMDRYGRTLAYLFTPAGVNVNEALVVEGWAKEAFYGDNAKFRPAYLAGAAHAEATGAGSWSECGWAPKAVLTTAAAAPTTAVATVPAPTATTPRPAPTAPPAASKSGVTPGAYCIEGARGATVSGTPMECKTKDGDDQARWRAA